MCAVAEKHGKLILEKPLKYSSKRIVAHCRVITSLRMLSGSASSTWALTPLMPNDEVPASWPESPPPAPGWHCRGSAAATPPDRCQSSSAAATWALGVRRCMTGGAEAAVSAPAASSRPAGRTLTSV